MGFRLFKKRTGAQKVADAEFLIRRDAKTLMNLYRSPTLRHSMFRSQLHLEIQNSRRRILENLRRHHVSLPQSTKNIAGVALKRSEELQKVIEAEL